MKILGEFQRNGDRVERRFTAAERKMITNLANGLIATLEGVDGSIGSDDAVVRRLLPVAAPDDMEASAEFADATRERLAEGKTAGARRLIDDLAAGPNGLVSLDAASAIVWLTALGDIRIALAERVGFDRVQSTASPHGLVYAWLTWLQGSLVEVVDTP